MRNALIVILLSLTALPAFPGEAWRADANDFDRDRIERHDEAFGRAVMAALAEGTAADVAELARVFADPPQPFAGVDLTGDWRCRTIKLGGPYGALTIYSWFRCRIGTDDQSLTFEKLTGSQRTSGRFYPDGEEEPMRLVYLGAAHYEYEEPKAYGGRLNLKGRDPENRDDVGVVTLRGPDHMLIGFPWPILESDYDVLELRR